MDIHTRQLRYFMELAKCLNFTKAAMNLYVAQPALSQQIAELEKQLGVTLFIRTSRSVSLTPAGKILQSACPRIMSSLENTKKQLLMAEAGLMGHLRIGHLNNLLGPLPQIMRRFSEAYPNVSIELQSSSLPDLTRSLEAGSIDVSLSFITPVISGESTPPILHNALVSEQLYLATPADHPFVADGCRDFSLLENTPMIELREEDSAPHSPLLNHSLISPAVTALGIHPKEIYYVNSPISILAYLEAGLAFSVICPSLIGKFDDSVRLTPIPGHSLDFGILWSDQSHNPVLPLFLDLVAQEFDTIPEK